MALVKTERHIKTIRGRFGGVYFKCGKDGQHIQRMPRTVKYTRSYLQQGEFGPFSPFAGFGITGFSSGAALWVLALIAGLVMLWYEYAERNVFGLEDGKGKHITGYNWYMHYAIGLDIGERPPFWKPPHAPGDLPDYIIVYKKMWMYDHNIEDWPAECPGDYYWYVTEVNGKPAYGNDSQSWYIWWDNANWVVSEGADYKGAGMYYISTGTDINGYYQNPDTNSWIHVYLGKPAE